MLAKAENRRWLIGGNFSRLFCHGANFVGGTMDDLSEADTRAKLIDPAIHARGWTEDFIKREESAGPVEVVFGKARRKSKGRTDYTLRVLVNPETQPVALALLEAKKASLPP